MISDSFLIGILAIAVITDLHWHKIPNWITFPAMMCGMTYGTIINGAQGFFFSSLGLAAGIGLLIMAYAIGGMGAGDVKLMGAIGSFLGAKNVLWACLFSCIFGALYALMIIIKKGNAKSFFSRYWLMLKTFLIIGKLLYIYPSAAEKAQKISYGVAIALGTLLFILGKDLNLRGYLP